MTARPGAPPLPYRIYRRATTALLPLAWRSVARKLGAAGVALERIAERKGHATLPRPDGPLIWFHAASVGESLSVLTLIARLGERLPEHEFLITSGTATSAALLQDRLPPRSRHQFAALDAAGPVRRFLDHWRPDAAIFVESELWPLSLVEARAAGARLALLNARMSRKSVEGWARWPDSARFVLDQFDVMITQNRSSADDLRRIGGDPARIRVGTNLKATSAPLPVDSGTRAALHDALAGRPLWVASSTHPGEEESVIAAHRRLCERHPDLCLLLVPRHPERGDAVARLVAQAGLSCARRSTGEALDGQQVYLADTLGETGTWYAAAPIVFLGGSLAEIGGHNPFEPAQAGAAVLTGPHVFNFAETYAPLLSLGGAREVADADALAAAVDLWLCDGAALDRARAAAAQFVTGRQNALAEVIDTLCTSLALEPSGA